VPRWICLLCLSLFACRSSRADEHLQRELSFFVPYVDIEAEEKAVRGVLAQRKLVVDQVFRKPGFVALSASTLDGQKTAVRVITQRGVVLGEDGDKQDYFGFPAVGLFSLAMAGPGNETLLGIVKTAHNQTSGCAQLIRVLADGRIGVVPVHIEQFGDRACLHALRSNGPQHYAATVAWPSLSPFDAPTLEIDMVPETARLDRPEDPSLGLRIETGGDWVRRATELLAEPLPGQAEFSVRHARGVALAALALVGGRSADAQLGAFRSAVGRVLPGSPEAEIVASTSTHIENGWLDSVPSEGTLITPDAGEEPIDPDSVIVEPPS
jgi:hypothetical protein